MGVVADGIAPLPGPVAARGGGSITGAILTGATATGAADAGGIVTKEDTKTWLPQRNSKEL